jgi:hypothetical protein
MGQLRDGRISDGESVVCIGEFGMIGKWIQRTCALLIAFVSVTAVASAASADQLSLHIECDICSMRGTSSCAGATEHQRKYGYVLAGQSTSETEEERYSSTWHLQIVDVEENAIWANVLLSVEHLLIVDGEMVPGDFEAEYHEFVKLHSGVDLKESIDLGVPSGGFDFTLLYTADFGGSSSSFGESSESHPGPGFPGNGTEKEPDHDCRITLPELHQKYEMEPNDLLHHCFGEAIEAGEYQYFGDRWVRIRFSMTPEGVVGDLEVLTEEYQGTKLETCLFELIESVKFGPTLCDGKKSVNYPFAPSEYRLRAMGKWKVYPKEHPGEAPELDLGDW